MRQPNLVVCAMLTLLVAADRVRADPLTIVSWGGAYEASQTEAYFKPFTAKTGTSITTLSYNGGIHQLRQQVESSNVGSMPILVDYFLPNP